VKKRTKSSSPTETSIKILLIYRASGGSEGEEEDGVLFAFIYFIISGYFLKPVPAGINLAIIRN